MEAVYMVNYPQSAIPQTGDRMTVQEYFQLDYTVPNEKYEYQDGIIRLREGATVAHCEITGSIRVTFKHNNRRASCIMFGSDLRVQVAEDCYFFPDLTVTCDTADRHPRNELIRSPRMVVEVLSPSTEQADRTDKLKAYQQCATIQEIVLIDQFSPHVEVYRRDEEIETEWSRAVYEEGEEVALESVDVFLTMDEIYHNIDFNEPLVEE
jgi:Uma2 family endonuclease